jgi:L,D-peptidoglycan transpeptidase YkuD (ErfK/YbiS/YcfS/YnhG family)
MGCGKLKKYLRLFMLTMVILSISIVHFGNIAYGEENYNLWTSYSNTESIASDKEWTIKFSDVLTYSDIENNIYIVEENSSEVFPTNLEICEDNRIVKIKHDTDFKYGLSYNLYIRKGITSKNSKLSLKKGIKMNFVIEENEKDLIYSEMNNSSQFITVITPNFDSTKGILTAYEKLNGQWKIKYSNIECVIGRNGLSYDKKEGDGKTPIGVFTIGQAFGRLPNPGTQMDYRQTNSNDYWVDDATSNYYNTWQVGPSSGRWNSAERLYYVKSYDYAAVVNYNEERIPYNGSAIFMHVFKENKKTTSGCISIEKEDLVKLLKWLKPDSNAKILICPDSEIDKF